MEIQKVQSLRGPNMWANFPVLEAWVDLGPYKDSPSDELPGFNDRLKAWLPSMIEHHCSVGERGGFFERLRRGTYQAHILEHVSLELQCLAGTDVGFGRARETSTEGVYKVVIEYDYEELGLAALEAGRRLCLAAIHDLPFDVAAEVERLSDLHRRLTPKAETAALVKAAKRRRIPVRFLNGEGLIQLGYGTRQHRLQGSQTDRTSATAEAIARDNQLTRNLLRAIGVPVPAGEAVASAAAAWEAAQELNGPVSVRPQFGKERRPEWSGLRTEAEVTAAFEAAADGARVLVEECLPGATHRLLIVGGRMVAAVRSDDGGAVEVTAGVHPEVAGRAVEAARVIGLDVAAVEVVTEDVGRPLEEKGAVRAVHTQPDLLEFLRPASGEPQPVAEAIIATLFPEGENGRIPVVSITGTNGKTTTTRLIAHILGQAYRLVGMACSESISIGSRVIETGDCSGPKSAQAVLQHPDVHAAVLETARGGILRAGLGFDKCLVAVVTNVGKGDHLGLHDIHTLEQVAKVKRTAVDVVLPEGAAVLNATDPLVAEMAEHCRGGVIYFARDRNHPVIERHRDAGKKAVFERDGSIVLAEGPHETPLVALARVPLTHGGRVGFNVENSLAAAAAAWAVGVPLGQIRAGLESFNSVMDQVPCRFNLLDYEGATIVLDYAHNISALESFLEVLGQFPHRLRSAVYSVPGDRSDEVITLQGEMLGAVYDRVFIYEDTEVRGRADGEISALIREGLKKGGRTREVVDIRGSLRAIDTAVAALRRGELLVIQPEFPTIGAEYFSRLVARGSREVTLEQACATGAGVALDVRG
jgi:UDP-N-acetylmuramyl tripeptide synthase